MEFEILMKCSFRKISNYPEQGLKLGRYSGSYHYNVKGFGKNKWVVLGYIDIDWKKEKELGKSDHQIIEGCITYLNSITKTYEDKKTKKQITKPIYGFFEVLKVDLKVKDDKPCLIAQLITNERTNPYFWGEGQVCDL